MDPASYPFIKERLRPGECGALPSYLGCHFDILYPGRLVLSLEDRAILARRAFSATAAYDTKLARAVEASLGM